MTNIRHMLEIAIGEREEVIVPFYVDKKGVRREKKQRKPKTTKTAEG